MIVEKEQGGEKHKGAKGRIVENDAKGEKM